MFKRALKKVSFVVGGVQKAGTSALDVYLRTHPDICMASVKEPHYFDDDEYFSLGDPDDRIYHALFKPAHGKQLLGDATPIYSYWQPCAERIHAYNPSMKWILSLRNPIERAFSHWKMEYTNRKERRIFSQAIRLESEALSDGSYQQNRTASYISRGLYTQQIKHIESLFPRDQIMIIKQEDLHASPTPSMNGVFKFLGVDPLESIDHRDVFSSENRETIGDEDRRWLTDLFTPEIQALEGLLGWDCQNWLRAP